MLLENLRDSQKTAIELVQGLSDVRSRAISTQTVERVGTFKQLKLQRPAQISWHTTNDDDLSLLEFVEPGTERLEASSLLE